MEYIIVHENLEMLKWFETNIEGFTNYLLNEIKTIPYYNETILNMYISRHYGEVLGYIHNKYKNKIF